MWGRAGGGHSGSRALSLARSSAVIEGRMGSAVRPRTQTVLARGRERKSGRWARIAFFPPVFCQCVIVRGLAAVDETSRNQSFLESNPANSVRFREARFSNCQNRLGQVLEWNTTAESLQAKPTHDLVIKGRPFGRNKRFWGCFHQGQIVGQSDMNVMVSTAA